MKSVYSAVRTESLNKAVCASSLKGKMKCWLFLLTIQRQKTKVAQFKHAEGKMKN